jgi:hypothetical protein
MGHKSPPSGPIQRQIHPVHGLLSLFKIHFKNIPPCTGFILFPHQLTFNLDEVFPFHSRKFTIQYTNRTSTNQKYCREPEKWCALYRRNLHSVRIPCWYFNMALFITAWLLFAGILVRASAKHFGERCRVRQGGGRVFVWPLQSIRWWWNIGDKVRMRGRIRVGGHGFLPFLPTGSCCLKQV